MPETAQNAASKLSESFSVGNCQIPVIFLADNRNLIPREVTAPFSLQNCINFVVRSIFVCFVLCLYITYIIYVV